MRKGLTRSADPPTSRRAGPLRVLFICSRNRRRSPTAEAVFSGRDDLDVASAGLAPDAEEVVNAETLAWAEIIVVMEKAHRARLHAASPRTSATPGSSAWISLADTSSWTRPSSKGLNRRSPPCFADAPETGEVRSARRSGLTAAGTALR